MAKDTVKNFNKLIKKISRKDEKSLEELYELYCKLIYTTALTVSKSSFKADEIVDDILVKIWRLANNLPNIENPEGWLYQITANCAKDKLKADKKYDEIYDLFENDAQIEINIEDEDFYKLISELNEVEQEIMIFKFIEDMTFEMIAKEMNKPLSSISSTYYRALDKLNKNNA